MTDFVDLKRQYSGLRYEVLTGIEECITNGQFVGGEWVEKFEKNFANYHGVDYCVGVGSGTDALWLSLLALGIGPGDEVIVPANTFIATAFAVTHTGAKVVFADVDPFTYNISYECAEKVITDKTKAIIPVHLYGNPVNMNDMKLFAEKHNLRVIEDCAQAVGAQLNDQLVGTFGDVGCFSFYPTKNLGGLGQGGAIITNDKNIADKVGSLSNVGRKKGSHYEYIYLGFNSRLDSINALFLDRCLKEASDWNRVRQSIGQLYNLTIAGLSGVDRQHLVSKCDMVSHVYHLYEIKCPSKELRSALRNYLMNQGIPVGLHYPIPCHKQYVYREYNKQSFPVAEELSSTLLSLPMHPWLQSEEVAEISSHLKLFFNGKGRP